RQVPQEARSLSGLFAVWGLAKRLEEFVQHAVERDALFIGLDPENPRVPGRRRRTPVHNPISR
ncbi:hypothetical protein, partial [Pseudomonas veronii]|uniref:hypothetical protein n=1 Tax=Pseudomonas veronii TaxID=76761 RepID=UPI001CC21F7E